MPEDARPDDRQTAHAIGLGIVGAQFEAEWQRFVAYHVSRGTLMANWFAAWQTWCSNVGRYAPPKGIPPAGASKSPVVDRQAGKTWCSDNSELYRAWVQYRPKFVQSMTEERGQERGAFLPPLPT